MLVLNKKAQRMKYPKFFIAILAVGMLAAVLVSGQLRRRRVRSRSSRLAMRPRPTDSAFPWPSAVTRPWSAPHLMALAQRTSLWGVPEVGSSRRHGCGGGGIVYDNHPGAGQDQDPTTVLLGGNIVIHK